MPRSRTSRATAPRWRPTARSSSRRALAALGVHDHVFLDGAGAAESVRGLRHGLGRHGQAGLADELPPRAFVGVSVEDAAQRLAAVLRDRRPDVVVTYEPGGGYGHPDHVRTHEVTRRAVELVGSVAGPARRGAAGARPPRGVRGAGTGVEGLSLPDADGPLPSVAVPDDEVDLEVDVLPVRDDVLAALRAHATQVQAVRRRRRRRVARRPLRPQQPGPRAAAPGRDVPDRRRARRGVAERRAPDSLTACTSPWPPWARRS